MYVGQSTNEYHHITVREVVDYSECSYPFVLIKGDSKIMCRDSKALKGYTVKPYSIQVRVRGMLMNYVLYEIDEGDNIFVIGHSEMWTPKKFPMRIVKAECIYKEDWMKYYNDYGNLNPIDTEDTI